ncbi:MAG: beta strand repeat-containing protein [Akkermansia muciniphila]
MKLHLPKALAAAVMALFAVPNALAAVTYDFTKDVELDRTYYLFQGAGDSVLTLGTGFSSLEAGVDLVTATVDSNTMSVTTAGNSCFKTVLDDTDRSVGTTGTTSGIVTVQFGSSGTKVFEGNSTSGTELVADNGLKFTGKVHAFTFSAETGVISSAVFTNTRVITNLQGDGDLSVSEQFLLIDGLTSGTGNSNIDLNVSGKGLSITGSVTLGAITTTSGIGSGIYVAADSTLSTESITCAWKPGDITVDGNLNNAGNFVLTTGSGNDKVTNLKGTGTLTVASILTHNGGRLNSSLANVHVTGNVDLGGATLTEGDPATDDILTVSGGAFTVDGTTTVRSGRSFNISGGTTTLTGAATVDGAMTVSGGTNTLASLSVSGTMTVSNGVTTATSVTVADGGVLKLTGSGGQTSKLRATNGLTVQSGGQLQFTAKDVTGYDGGDTSLKKITIENGGILWLNHATNETFAGELNLAGTLKGNGSTTQWDFFGSSTLKVADNVSTAKVENLTIRLRTGATTFTIGKDSMLTIGDIQKGTDFNGPNNTLTVTGAGNGCGTLAVTGAATLNNLSVSGASGAVSFTGGTLSAAKIHTTGNNASVTIGDDTHNVVATVGRFELGDNSTNGGNSLLTIASGSKVIVTGNDTAGNDAYKNVGIVLGEWNNTTTAQIAGNLVAADASIQAGDKGYTAVISETGLVAVKGLYSSKGTGAVAVTLNGGKLILGEKGVQRGTVTLNGGTIGSSFTATDTASMTIAGSVVLSDSSSTAFDTNLYSLNTTSGQDTYGTVTRSETDGTTITVTGDLSGEGTVRVIGNGILTLAGNIEVGAIEGAGITNITGQIIGGNVQDVNILATQDSMGTAATLAGTINFDVQNGNFTHGDETYSTTTGIKTVTRELFLLNDVDATQFTGATFKVNGEDAGNLLEIDSDGIRGTFTSDTTTYLIAGASDEISWSTVQEAGCDSVEFSTGGIEFSAGGKLTTASTDIVNSSAIEVQNGVTGSRLSGSGTYVLESGSTDIKVDSLTNWTGTVAISGNHTGLNLGDSKLGNTGSTILINNVSASLVDATVNANVKLDSSGDDGLMITGTGATVTFKGNVTGDKTAINIINRASGTTLNFAGEENKAVQIIDESGSAISFSGKATDISTSIVSQMANTVTSVSFDNTAAVSMSGDILNDKWLSQNAKGDLSVNLNENTKVTFSGTVHANTLNVASGAEASFTKATSLDKVVGSGTFSSTVAQGITLGTATDSKFTGSIKALGGAVIQAAFAGTDAQEGSLAKIDATAGSVNLLNTSSVTVTDMVIGAGQTVGVYRGDTTTAATGNEGALTVTNLTVTSSEGSEGGAATLNANLNLTGTTLTLNGVLTLGSELTLGSGNTLKGVDWSTLTNGQSITLIEGVDSIAGGYTGLITAGNVFSNVTDTSTMHYSLVYSDQAQTLTLQASNVPEPTTATLSLLALMGLAARRRRKAAK